MRVSRSSFFNQRYYLNRNVNPIYRLCGSGQKIRIRHHRRGKSLLVNEHHFMVYRIAVKTFLGGWIPNFTFSKSYYVNAHRDDYRQLQNPLTLLTQNENT